MDYLASHFCLLDGKRKKCAKGISNDVSCCLVVVAPLVTLAMMGSQNKGRTGD
jgi:hypothetical protein